MLNREHLETFALIAQFGSFEQASKLLSVTRGAVSQRVKALEDTLGMPILHRAKPARATPAGEALLRHVHMLRALEASTMRELSPRQLDRPLFSAAVTFDCMATWFRPVVSEIMATGHLTLDLVSDHPDRTLDHLVRGAVAGCVSSQPGALPGFTAAPLGALEYRCVASPALARRHFPGGLTAHQLLKVPAVQVDRRSSRPARFIKDLFGFDLERSPSHYVSTAELALHATLSDGGYAVLPAAQARPYIETGALVDLTPDVRHEVPLYWHTWINEPEPRRSATDAVLAIARSRLAQH